MKRTHPKKGGVERRLLISCVLLVAVGILFVTKMPERIAAMEDKTKYNTEFYEFAELFSEIYGDIRSRYVEEVDSKKLFEGAINGMMSALDEHSSWLPPDEQEMLTRDTEGEYSGVGMHIGLRDHILTVISPIPGSPAARAGILPWDRVVKIDGESTKDITTMDAVKKLTGPTGTKVGITIWREGEPELLEFSVAREKIKIDSVFAKLLDDKIGYMRISKFQEDTADSVRKELKEFSKQNITGIIIDVRNDPGGLLDGAVEVCDMFLPKNQLIVSIKGRSKANNREYYSLEDPICTVPMLVLVNQGSASASEIFAGAMQDTHRGVIVGPAGANTYGKGSVQTISPLKFSLDRDANGNYKASGLRLTTAHYYTPSGKLIHKKGIKPDIGVDLPKGHEVALLQHGLLGDPDMTEDKLKSAETGEPATAEPEATPTPKEKSEATPEATPGEDKAAEGQAKDNQSVQSIVDQLNKSKQATPETKPFQDILLDEAVKYLKAILIYQESEQKAA